MSILSDGERASCDGEGCGAESQRNDGWLFVTNAGEHRHYCPTCLTAYLDSLSEPLLTPALGPPGAS